MTSQNSCLRFFPIPLFGSVMGLSGLTIAHQRASSFFGNPPWVGKSLAFFVLSLFIVITLTYISKIIFHFDEVKMEFLHPIRMNFFPAFSISLLLLSIVFHPINHVLSFIFWVIGAPLQLLFTLIIIRHWIVNNMDINHSNPAWFIPIVGNVIVPIMGVQYAGIEIAQFYFSLGIFFWIVLFTIIFNRILFHHQLAPKFLPTLFIFIAPAAVGFVSYVKIQMSLLEVTGGPTTLIQYDFIAHFLYDLALFFTLLVFFIGKPFLKLKFSITWWAYTFPLTAITIATMLNYQLTRDSHPESMILGFHQATVFSYLSQGLLFVASAVVLLVFVLTVKSFLRKEVCIEE